MKDIFELKKLAGTVSNDMDSNKLDRVYNEVLLPLLKLHAERFKTDRVDIDGNTSDPKVRNLMLELFDRKFTLQTLIETEMKPYLLEKGFNIITWTPSYSVSIKW